MDPRIKEILDEIPLFEPDPEQSFFYKSMDKYRTREAEGELVDLQIVNTTTGWPSSYINMGWLRCAMNRLTGMGLLPDKDSVLAFMGKAIQRLKYFKADPDDDCWHITFKTKDDSGWFVYGLTIKRSVPEEEK